MNARNVIQTPPRTRAPFDIDTDYGTVTLQRAGSFVYTASMGQEHVGYVKVNRPGTETLYTAQAAFSDTAWHRDTLEDCTAMLALHHAEGN